MKRQKQLLDEIAIICGKAIQGTAKWQNCSYCIGTQK